MVSVVLLGALAVLALSLTSARRSPPAREAERRAAGRALLVATAVQAVHFLEEAATGFHARLPALFGQPAYPFAVFALFNVSVLAIWLASVPALRAGRAPAFFAAWFLAVASVANGIAHPLFALADSSYFPGLFTSPFSLAAGAFLLVRLRRATDGAAGA